MIPSAGTAAPADAPTRIDAPTAAASACAVHLTTMGRVESRAGSLAGQAQDPLGGDVAQDLRGAAGDREAAGDQHLVHVALDVLAPPSTHPVAEQLDDQLGRPPGGCVRRAAWRRSTPRRGPGRRASAAWSARRAASRPSPARPHGRPATRSAGEAAARPASTARSTLTPSLLPAIATRSLASVVRASVQPSPGSPTTQSSGTNTSSRKTSLNIASPVISRSGRTSMPAAVMSTQEVGDALVLRGVRVGARQADRPVGLAGPATSTPSGRSAATRPRPSSAARAQRGQVGARSRLAEQLAPGELAEQRRPHEPLPLLVGAVLEDRRHRPAADLEVGPLHAGARPAPGR